MAPKKGKRATPSPSTRTAISRVTRSSSTGPLQSLQDRPAAKRAKKSPSSSQTSKEVKPKVKRGRKPVKKEEVMADDSNEEKPDEAEDGEVSGEDEPAKLGDGDESDGGDEPVKTEKDADDDGDANATEKVKDSDDKAKAIIIVEHCKQCKSFERRAIEVRELLSTVAPGVTVKFNPEKDLKRPFKQMKELDLNVVVAEIVEKIAAGN
ncbi:hypothetical protein GIB67_035737 [Kingdonia uniflora]|uniref:Selenoprotein H n=1 Tax=Kingdonia uniflora TaxID=39325 RepID=A0A7J7L1B4_9MAGN|nr:hypothetical protein GIB67_006643 [Kingdonia uniflora]KAF6171347.1 hypothetical protein GIB67_035737 [Kingdonia uniflora]